MRSIWLWAHNAGACFIHNLWMKRTFLNWNQFFASVLFQQTSFLFVFVFWILFSPWTINCYLTTIEIPRNQNCFCFHLECLLLFDLMRDFDIGMRWDKMHFLSFFLHMNFVDIFVPNFCYVRKRTFFQISLSLSRSIHSHFSTPGLLHIVICFGTLYHKTILAQQQQQIIEGKKMFELEFNQTQIQSIWNKGTQFYKSHIICCHFVFLTEHRT